MGKKEYYNAFIDVGWDGKKVTFKSKEFDKHHHIHMMKDKEGPDELTFTAATGYKISDIKFDPDDGAFSIMTNLPAAIVGVSDTNPGTELEKYSVTVTLQDDSTGATHKSDPKIVNDPGN